MRYLFTIFIQFISLLSYSQSYRTDYLVYHTYINEAETSLVNGKIDSCLCYYDKAFTEFDYIFAKDAFIAAQVALKHNDSKRTISYLIKGARYGLTIDCFVQSSIFNDIQAAPWYNTLSQGMTQANDLYKKNTDTALANEWKARFTKEQYAKNHAPFAEYKQDVLNNVARVNELIHTKGYPGEKLIGLSGMCHEMGNYWAFYSLAHYDYAATEFFEDLWNAVRKGELHPRDFASLCEFETVRNKVPPSQIIRQNSTTITPLYLKFNLNWFHDTDEASLKQAAGNRMKYYLCSEETDKKKAALGKSEGYQFFFNYK